MWEQTLQKIKEKKVIAILRLKSVEEAMEKGKAIFEAGMEILEVTFTVPNASEVIRKLKNECPKALIGAGTVLNVSMCREALDAGAEFIVSPNYDEEVSEMCRMNGKLYIPGVMTPTEIVRAMNGGNKTLKLFPGEVLGPVFVKAMKGPFPDVEFVATGGVSLENIEQWFQAGVIAVGMGGSLVNGPVEEVKRKVEKIVNKVKEMRF